MGNNAEDADDVRTLMETVCTLEPDAPRTMAGIKERAARANDASENFMMRTNVLSSNFYLR